MAVRLIKNSNRRNDVRHYRLVHSWTFDFAGLSSNLAYITSVFIGYIGTDSIGIYLSTPLLKKADEDGRTSIINVRRSSIWLAWSEGTDNGRQKNQNRGYDVIVVSYLLITPITLANLSR